MGVYTYGKWTEFSSYAFIQDSSVVLFVHIKRVCVRACVHVCVRVYVSAVGGGEHHGWKEHAHPYVPGV